MKKILVVLSLTALFALTFSVSVYAKVDIDNFKTINATLVHNIGDMTLKESAKFFQNFFSEEGFEVFRIGGDEFAIIAIEKEEDQIKEKIAILNQPTSDDHIACRFSAGFAKADPLQNNYMENSFIIADRNMYDVKRQKKVLLK